MKILWVVSLTILVATLVQSVPSKEGLKESAEDDGDMLVEKQAEETLGEDDSSVAEQGEEQEENDDKSVATELNSDPAENEDEDENNEEEKVQMMDLAQYQKEVEDYFREEKESSKHQRVRRQNSKGAIQSGNTIALQTFVKDHYLGCAGRHCGRATCPRMHFDGNDWTRCWGEVFRIYRARGRGFVRVGDMVGIYYPRESGKWLGCAGRICGKAPCPGKPTIRYGFNNRGRWHCWGEVFKIYAKGKNNNAVINSNDEISLYFVRGRSWVSQGYGRTVKKPCLGHRFPPSVKQYDGCAHETFTIWKGRRC